MRIDTVTVSLYDDDKEEDYHITLWGDSSNDEYPKDVEISYKIQKKIFQIRKIAFGDNIDIDE